MKSKANYIDPEQFQLILSNLSLLGLRKWTVQDVQFLFKISYWAGLRMNEACRLKKEDFSLFDREIYLGLTKGKKNQYAPIPDPFLPELKYWLDSKQDGQLLKGLTPQTVRNWTRKLGGLLDIQAWTTPQSVSGEKTRTHIFRKSIGKDMLYGTHGQKAPLNVVSKQLRHDNLVTTSKYLQVDIEAVKEWWQQN